jgi:hypothetical protein
MLKHSNYLLQNMQPNVVVMLFARHDMRCSLLCRYEVLAMLQHSNHLESEYGAGPHTISVPRLRPADGSDLSIRPPHEVRCALHQAEPCGDCYVASPGLCICACTSCQRGARAAAKALQQLRQATRSIF